MRLLQDRQDRETGQDAGVRLGLGLGLVIGGADVGRGRLAPEHRRGVASALGLLVAVVLAGMTPPAIGDPATAPATSAHRLVALVAADDVRASIAIGPAGELYEPDGHGAWVRRHAGGIASEIATAARAGQALIVGTHAGAYRLIASGGPSGAMKAWSVIYLGQHAKPVTAFGGRAIAAVGRQLFALDRGEPVHLADAATAILAIGASPTGVAVLTDQGIFRFAGKAFAPIAGAPHQIAKLVSDRWALVDRGAFDLRTGAMIAWPSGFTATVVANLADDTLAACAATPDGFELVTLRNGKLDRERVPIAAPPGTPAAIVGDRAGRLVVALTDGRLALRDRGAWTTTAVRDELPAPRPGSPPAISH